MSCSVLFLRLSMQQTSFILISAAIAVYTFKATAVEK